LESPLDTYPFGYQEMEKLQNYVTSVNTQIGELLVPGKTGPSPEQLHNYITKVVASLGNITAKAPTTVKSKVQNVFGPFWNIKENTPGVQEMTAVQLQICFGTLLKELPNMTQPSNTSSASPQPATEEKVKKFTGEQTTIDKELPHGDDHAIAVIIGPKGEMMKRLQEMSECNLTIVQGSNLVKIIGPRDGAEHASKAIDELLEFGSSMQLMGEGGAQVTIKLSQNQVPEIVPQFQTIKKECNVDIKITDNLPPPSKGGKKGGEKGGKKPSGPEKKARIIIGGSKENVERAKEVFESILTYHHHPITHKDFVHGEIEVEPWIYQRVIGTKGSEIKHMQNSYHVKVYIPNAESTNQKVMVVGEPRSVEKCIAHIENIVWKANNPTGGRDNYGGGDYADDDGGLEDWEKAYMWSSQKTSA